MSAAVFLMSSAHGLLVEAGAALKSKVRTSCRDAIGGVCDGSASEGGRNEPCQSHVGILK
jgi:hypothetical protein